VTTNRDAPAGFLLDVNVLIALTNPAHVHHQRAHQWFAVVERWATTAMTEAGFVRLMLNRAVTGTTWSGRSVLDALASLRAQSGHFFITDSSSLSAPSINLAGLVAPAQVTDLHLANLAASAKVQLATFDKGIKEALLPEDRIWVHLI